MNKSYDELTTYNPKEEGFDSLVESIDCNHISRCVPPQMYDTDMIIERLKDGYKKLKKANQLLLNEVLDYGIEEESVAMLFAVDEVKKVLGIKQ